MKFSKQINSLDRKFAPYREKYDFFNKIYNHLSKINITHTFHSAKTQKNFLQRSEIAIEKLLEPTFKTHNSVKLPKIIWIYWHSGFDSAPELVKLCLKSWQTMNPNYEIRCLDNTNLHHYLDFNFKDLFYLSSVRCLLPTKADILRLYLLSQYGGIWVDATTFCLSPLDEWLPESFKACHLFNFKQKDNLTRPIEAWFIAAPKGAPIINDVLAQYIDYITRKRALSLYISGKVPLLEKVISEQEKTEPLNPDVSYKSADKFNFMPYFSIAYFFYSAINKHLTEKQIEIFLRKDTSQSMCNNYALTKDPFEIFEHAYVSKQTYTRSYTKSKLFYQRKEILLDKLKMYQ